MKFAHIGLPKTGTTYLQKNYFSKLNCDFYSTQEPFIWPKDFKFVYQNNIYIEELNRKINWEHSEFYSYEKYTKDINRLYKKSLKRVSSCRKYFELNKNFIFSSEGIYGLTKEINLINLRLLKEAKIDKIIFIIRRQTDWIKSFWTQLIVSEDRYCKYISPDQMFSLDNSFRGFGADWYEYVKNCFDVFGEQNVLVLPYEMLNYDLNKFYEKLNSFLIGINSFVPENNQKINLSKNYKIYRSTFLDNIPMLSNYYSFRRLIRAIIKFGPKNMNLLSKEIETNFPDEFLSKIFNKYESSNSKLSNLINLDLSQYGYC